MVTREHLRNVPAYAQASQKVHIERSPMWVMGFLKSLATGNQPAFPHVPQGSYAHPVFSVLNFLCYLLVMLSWFFSILIFYLVAFICANLSLFYNHNELLPVISTPSTEASYVLFACFLADPQEKDGENFTAMYVHGKEAEEIELN